MECFVSAKRVKSPKSSLVHFTMKAQHCDCYKIVSRLMQQTSECTNFDMPKAVVIAQH